jgi:addiction module RelB/DinJ family antitoxin
LKTTACTIQLDPGLKAEAEQTFAEFDLDLSQAISIFLQKSVKDHCLSFSLPLTENGFTPEFEAELLAEAEELYREIANGTAKVYANAAELFADIDAEND